YPRRRPARLRAIPMCGIAGIIDRGLGLGAAELSRLVAAMRDTMVHRGPDDAGIWTSPDGTVALGHRRLSIIDLRPEGRQPMANEDGSVQVVFNGEIYNHAAIRRRLESAGHRFRTRTDTEVLPHLLEGEDPDAICRELRGMFAFAGWSERTRTLTLARDPFGKKPLYLAEGSGFLAFASELQALERLPFVDRTIDRDGLAGYLLVQYVPGERTIYRGVRKLAPGSWEHFPGDAGGAVRQGRFFSFAPRSPAAESADPVELREELRIRVRTAVERRLESDVPLGAFLSGGVDSSLVVAMLVRDFGRPVQTFSIGFDEPDSTEHLFARETAALLGTDHHDEVLSPDVMAMLPEIASSLDEPNGDSSCLPTLLLCGYARRFVTVAMSGDGGDELFGGYGRYRDTLNECGPRGATWRSRVRGWLRGEAPATPSGRYLSPRWLMFQPEAVAEFMGGAIPPGMSAELEGWRRRLEDPTQTPLQRMRHLDADTYMPGAVLPKVDRMSMRCSLEVRCPLLDQDVAAFAETLSDQALWAPPDGTKRILKDLAAEYLPRSWMERRKMGFGMPSRGWSHAAMMEMAEAHLGADCRLASLLDAAALRRFVQSQRDPTTFSIYRLWPMLVLELWLEAR
ncbi:MAG: asparagine synthase (glutamine-hydrolyzing), partial [Phycisphaerales bacterium]